MRNIFYSQLGEDFFIYRNFINQKISDGVFIELGALDGEKYSNTKFYEDTLDFSGLLIEPVPDEYEKLKKNRIKSACYNFAISNHRGVIEFIGTNAISGIPKLMPKTLINKKHGEKKYNVNTCLISDLINKENLSYIDLMTIDVEGGELVVLESMNWSIPIYLICIELDGNNQKKDDECRKLLIKNGFSFSHRVFINEFWVNENYYRKPLLYKKTSKEYVDIIRCNKHPYAQPQCLSQVNKEIKDYENSKI